MSDILLTTDEIRRRFNALLDKHGLPPLDGEAGGWEARALDAERQVERLKREVVRLNKRVVQQQRDYEHLYAQLNR